MNMQGAYFNLKKYGGLDFLMGIGGLAYLRGFWAVRDLYV